ncbi:hypothetical protein NPIL_566961 [Nephila pilipes]|uniref:Uncharacterized protein n=1 Tax=Nephila pilipes TaxID=299642 RepID=A0A8X6MW18_NEPPI|nr:hypothetical protein NPIL_566961 [Nephila pilipes]
MHDLVVNTEVVHAHAKVFIRKPLGDTAEKSSNLGIMRSNSQKNGRGLENGRPRTKSNTNENQNMSSTVRRNWRATNL